MSGSMQGLGATGTGYQGNTGNSLLQQLILQHMMGGGGTGSYSPTSNPLSGVMGGAGQVTNNPMSGMIGANQRLGGMNPQVQAQPVQMQGNTGGMSSGLSGANLQQVLQALQQRQQQQGNPNSAGSSLYPGALSGLWGNLTGQYTGASPQSLLQGANAVSTPTSIQNALGLSKDQYVP